MDFTFNKDNWTGGDATISVTNFAGVAEWTQNGYKVELRNRKRYDDFTVYEIWVDGRMSDHKVDKGEADAEWGATNHDGSCSRFGNAAPVAAARLLFNLM